MKKLIAVVIMFLGIAIVVLSFGELETILATLQHAHLPFLFLALVFQFLWFLSVGRMYQETYRLLGLDESAIMLSRVSAAANFINIVAPSGGVGGIAVFVAEARRRGQPPGKVTLAAALVLLIDPAAFLLVLALGLIVLIRRNDLSAGEITASLILFGIAVSYAFVLYIGYRSEQKLGDFLARLARMVNAIARLFIHREYLSEARAHEFAHEVSDGLSGITEKPSSLLRPILWALLNKALLMGVLLSAFLSFEVPFSAGTIIAGFSMAYLFLIVSPTPSGIGIVEGVMPLALTSLRVDYSQAVVITLAYRAVTFWVPMVVGAWVFQSLHMKESEIPT